MKRIFDSVAIASALVLSACSPNEKLTLKGIDLSTSHVGGDTYIDMEAIIVTGNLKFPNIEVPVMNPASGQSFGQMALQHLDDGTNRIYVSIDYDDAIKLDPKLGKTLPNGREVPSQLGVGSAALVGVPVLEQSRIYVGGDLQKDLFIGAAISIPALDTTFNQVPVPLNLFFNFPFSTEIMGEAGLFSSPQKSQNGVAVFVKKSAPTTHPSSPSRKLASISESQPVLIPSGGEEIKHLGTFTLFRLNQLFERHATVKVK